jgi:hypothetical protein
METAARVRTDRRALTPNIGMVVATPKFCLRLERETRSARLARM